MSDTTTSDDKIISGSPHTVDVHVGQRVRQRRKIMGLSQQDLARALGLTFQQVQKYERGTNRVSASKLWEIARTLKVPVAYFFDGDLGYIEGAQDGVELDQEQAVSRFLATAEGIDLARAFPLMTSARLRRKVVELVKTLAED